MNTPDVTPLMQGEDEDARCEIARRVGARLCNDNLPVRERKAAEALAWYLAVDAITRVRVELSHALKQARFLSKDIALRIAHDVDDVACPFLAVTEVFTDEDWQELVKTISSGALAAIAGRVSLSEGLVVAIAREADARVAENLVDNASAPMTRKVCEPIMDNHGDVEQVMDKLSQRPDLHPEIAAKLIAKVSAAARAKLSERYSLPDYTEPVADEAEIASTIKLIKQTSAARLASVAKQLRDEDKLDHRLLIAALRDEAVEFFEAAMSLLTNADLLKIKRAVRLDGPEAFAGLLTQAEIPSAIHDDFWKALQSARKS